MWQLLRSSVWWQRVLAQCQQPPQCCRLQGSKDLTDDERRRHRSAAGGPPSKGPLRPRNNNSPTTDVYFVGAYPPPVR